MTQVGLPIAIVGAGLMGRWHAYYAARAGAEVAALVDRDPCVAAALSAKFPHARVFTDLQSCLAQVETAAVHICTPTASHVPLATAALHAGVHVLLEKPLAATRAETEHLLALARDQGVLLAPVHQFPFQRGVRRVRRSRARLGDLVRLAYVTCTAGGEGLAGAARRELLLEILPHPVSLFHAFLGDAAAAIAWDLLDLTDDDLELRGRLGGVHLHALLSLRGRPTRNALTVYGTGGTAHADLYHGYALIETGEPSWRTKLLQPFAHGTRVLAGAGGNLAQRALRREPAYPGLPELIATFYRAVAHGGPAPVGEAEMLAAPGLMDRLRSDAPPLASPGAAPLPLPGLGAGCPLGGGVGGG